MTDRIDPKTIADELRNQASPSAIQRDIFARAANTIDALVKERDHFRIGVQEMLKTIRDLGINLHEAERERDALVKQLADADRQFTALKESSGKADARAVELAAVVEKVRLMVENEGDKFRPIAARLGSILSSAPADALAEHDAALIEKVLKDLWTEIHVQRFAADSHAADIPGVVKTNVNTFYAGVVRARSMVDSARARQVREGEA